MAITLEKITNIGLKLSNSMVIPVIRAVVSNFGGSHTAQEMQNLFLDIYNHSYGAVSVTSYYHSFGALPPDFIPIAPGTYDYGDNNGFMLRQTVTHHEETGRNWELYTYGLYFEDNTRPIAMANVLTGYSSYEYSPLIILTDDDYNLIYSRSEYTSGFQIRSENELGIATQGGVTVCGVWGDGLYYCSEGSITYPETPTDNIKDMVKSEIDPSTNDDDPYNPGGTSTGDGGGGDHDNDSDPVDIPSLPSLSAVDTGFITLFNPSLAQLKSLASYMWTGLFDIENFRKIFADPMDCILGLSIVPGPIPDGGSKTVTVGNISTGINMTVAARQYIEIDCGSVTMSEYWGAYLDYEPYTKAEIYLPYIGTHPISIDDIMKKTIRVVYHIDILSGSCTAYVKCGESILYSFIGQCSSSIPITGNDWTNVINGALSIATAIGTMVATGGASAPSAVGEIASTAINTMKPSIEKSGSMSGTGGLLAVQKPYIILTRPRQALPASQNMYMGYPSFITSYLGVLSGYTEMEHIHLDGINATDEELNEIEKLLKTGVIL